MATYNIDDAWGGIGPPVPMNPLVVTEVSDEASVAAAPPIELDVSAYASPPVDESKDGLAILRADVQAILSEMVRARRDATRQHYAFLFLLGLQAFFLFTYMERVQHSSHRSRAS